MQGPVDLVSSDGAAVVTIPWRVARRLGADVAVRWTNL
jgi:hypothetical protein